MQGASLRAWYRLVMTNLAAEHCLFIGDSPMKMAKFHGYLSLSEGSMCHVGCLSEFQSPLYQQGGSYQALKTTSDVCSGCNSE